jgi:EAL domain-containing protein (putative c-di-GMP-specific phosphodiesterase class I)
MAYVRGRGCQYSQGYLLAPPMPPAEFSRWWFEQQSPLPPSTLIH